MENYSITINKERQYHSTATLKKNMNEKKEIIFH